MDSRLPFLPRANVRIPALIATQLLCFAMLAPIAHSAEEPTSLNTGHVDLRIDYDAGRSNLLEILVSDDDHARELPASSAVLVVAEAAKLQLPGDLPPLGRAGDFLWVVPQSQNPEVLFLGLSAEDNPAGVFAGPLELRLMDVQGPGNLFFWQSDLGTLDFFFDSANGFGPDDSFPQIVGSHNHGNWGFTTNGIYRVTLQAFGQRAGESTNIFSPPTVFEFRVEPVPTNASPFQAWQGQLWPNTSDPAIIGPEADPDHDGRRNLEEYALGTDPQAPDRSAANSPSIQFANLLGTLKAEIRLLIRRDRADVDTILLAASNPAGPWVPLDIPGEELPSADGASKLERILVWKVPFEVAPTAVRFYRVGYQLNHNL